MGCNGALRVEFGGESMCRRSRVSQTSSSACAQGGSNGDRWLCCARVLRLTRLSQVQKEVDDERDDALQDSPFGHQMFNNRRHREQLHGKEQDAVRELAVVVQKAFGDQVVGARE